MATASLKGDSSHVHRHPAPPRPRRRRKAPLPLRPIHRAWRRSIDRLDATRIMLPVRGLPDSLAGTVACQISDLHLDRDEDVERLEEAVALINHHRPEFVFLTGDYFSGSGTTRRYLDAFRRVLGDLKPSIGTFAIAGNHDHWASFDRIAEALEGAGIDVLANESRRIAMNGAKLVIVGVDDLWARRAEPARAFAKVDPNESTIVLAHNPDTALYMRHLNPGVVLSGHTHGGVVRIPFYGAPLRSILRIGKKFYAGLNRFGDFYIYTNRGLGTFMVRIRINCRPEVSRFDLVPLRDASNGVAAPRVSVQSR